MNFSYVETTVKDLKVNSHMKGKKHVVDSVEVEGRPIKSSQRFWTSLQARFGFSKNIFELFDHKETFDRIHDRKPNSELRIAVEHSINNNGEPVDRLLAVTNPNKAFVDYDGLMGLLGEREVDVDKIDFGDGLSRRRPNQPQLSINLLGRGVTNNTIMSSSSGDGGARTVAEIPPLSYHEGIIRSIHTPRNSHEFPIGGDSFCNRFVMDTPIDGYGLPALYLMLVRTVCTNGAIGYTQMFKSEISLGKKESSYDFAIKRALDGFNNEEGFNCLRQRFEMAQKSWASINEVSRVYKSLIKLHSTGDILGVTRLETAATSDDLITAASSPIIKSFNKMTGDLHSAYGLTNLDTLPAKRQRALPTGANMYDLINFTSEVATHYSTPAGARQMQAIIGDLVSAEFDLEDTVSSFPNWTDFLIKDAAAIEAKPER